MCLNSDETRWVKEPYILPKVRQTKTDLPPLGDDLQPATHDYAGDLIQFLAFLRRTKQVLSYDAIECFFNTLTAKRWASSTWNRKRCALKTSILIWLDEIEAYQCRSKVEWFFRHKVRYVKKS